MYFSASRASIGRLARPSIGRLARPTRLAQHPSWATSRHASLNSAIGRGIRRSTGRDFAKTPDATPRDRRARGTEKQQFAPRDRRDQRDTDSLRSPRKQFAPDDRRPRDTDSFRDPRKQFVPRDRRDQSDTDSFRGPRKHFEPGDGRHRRDTESINAPFDEEEFIRSGNFRALPQEHQRPSAPRYDSQQTPPFPVKRKASARVGRVHRPTNTSPERIKEHTKVPDSVPYTTPASEFIYGTNAVEAALRCSRRQLYKLYLYQGQNEELGAAKISLRKLALTKSITTKVAFAEWDRLLDKMSAGRPHNGCVIEASPLPKTPVQSLLEVPAVTESHFRVELAPQTREEALVNGTNDQIPILYPPETPPGSQSQRYPVALMLDGIVDTGNLGAIIRSAYFLGIDAIIFAGRNSAPLSPVTIKASAGAAENMTLLQVKNEVDFIQKSQANGWRFYAADAPGPGATYLDRTSGSGEGSNPTTPTTQSPSVIMMGSEASGLSTHIKSHADAIISIPGARHGLDLGVESDPARVDSLNVSVAAALLMNQFLHTPLALSNPVQKRRSTMW